jgi:hypothetical protein
MSLRLTEYEMLEKRCQSWEKTRHRGKFLYSIFRGMILCGFWFLVNILGNTFGNQKMSYEALAIVSIIFFLVGCWEAPSSWDKAEKRYDADKQYLESRLSG